MSTAALATAPPKRQRRKLSRRLLRGPGGRSLEITKAGWWFIALTMADGFAAINSGANLLHVIFGIQLGMIIGSGVLSENMLRRVRARRRYVGPLYARTTGALRVEIENTSTSPALSISVEDEDADRPQSGRGRVDPVFRVSMEPKRRVDDYAQIVMPTRGRHRLPTAVVATRFPFGLFVKRRRLDDETQVVVYPHVDPQAPPPRRAAVEGSEQEAGGGLSRAGEIYGLRPYRPGDGLSRVNWRATARRQMPIVTEFEARGEQEYWLELPTGEAGDPEFEAAIEALASTAVAHLHSGEASVGLRHGPTTVVDVERGPEHEHRILTELALWGLDPESDA